MKITFLLPAISIAGGIRSTLELANRLHGRGHHVSVVYPLVPMRSGAKWYNIRNLASRILGITRNLEKGNKIEWFNLNANLIRVPTFREKWIPKGDVIIATWWANAYTINSYGLDKGKKYYFIRHYEIWGGPEDLVDKTYKLPLHKIVTSTWLKNLIEKKFNVSTSGPLPNGTNFDLFYKENKNFHCHSPKRIGMIYRSSKWKGMKDGLRAFQLVKKRFPDTQLVLFGEKPVPEDRNIIDVIGDIEFHNLPYKEELRKIYNSLDIFLFPSHCEGFGNPPMEAMACGAACVATNTGAILDYSIAGENILVSNPNDIQALAQNMLRLLEDEDTREKIAKSGHQYIKQFTWDRTTDQLERIFMKLSSC